MTFRLLPVACLESRCSCKSHNGFLTGAGYAEVDLAARRRYLDKVVSVRGLLEVEDDFDYVENHNELYIHPSQLEIF